MNFSTFGQCDTIFVILYVKKLNLLKHLKFGTYKLFKFLQPLPGKHTILAQLDRYSKEFIVARMALLHRFLNRIAKHPVLSCNQSVKVFLTAKPSVSCITEIVLLLILSITLCTLCMHFLQNIYKQQYLFLVECGHQRLK